MCESQHVSIYSEMFQSNFEVWGDKTEQKKKKIKGRIKKTKAKNTHTTLLLSKKFVLLVVANLGWHKVTEY